MEEKNSDFVKSIYENNEVKDVSEAFIKYPVEEEWHEGKVENIISEPKEYYSVYDIGDIVFVKDYEYSSKKKGNNHLFVIIDKNNMAVPIENIAMLISSRLEKTKYSSNKLLPKSETNGLQVDSIVKTDEVYKILNSQILFRIGIVDADTIELYKNSYKLITKDKFNKL